jgi:hypothetical protein
MADKLMGFLLKLASNPDELARFIAHPESEMRAAGLSGQEKAALKTRDVYEIHRVLGGMTRRQPGRPGPPGPPGPSAPPLPTAPPIVVMWLVPPVKSSKPGRTPPPKIKTPRRRRGP